MPYSISAGKGSINEGVDFTSHIEYLVSDTSHHYMKLSFAAKDPEKPGEYGSATAIAAYEVQGDKIVVRYVAGWNYDEDTKEVNINFSDKVDEFNYRFQGIYLTLSNKNGSVTMCRERFCDYSPEIKDS